MTVVLESSHSEHMSRVRVWFRVKVRVKVRFRVRIINNFIKKGFLRRHFDRSIFVAIKSLKPKALAFVLAVASAFVRNVAAETAF